MEINSDNFSVFLQSPFICRGETRLHEVNQRMGWLINGCVRGVIAFIHPGKFLAKFNVRGVDQIFLALK
jgi:hypothetical protein